MYECLVYLFCSLAFFARITLAQLVRNDRVLPSVAIAYVAVLNEGESSSPHFSHTIIHLAEVSLELSEAECHRRRRKKQSLQSSSADLALP